MSIKPRESVVPVPAYDVAILTDFRAHPATPDPSAHEQPVRPRPAIAASFRDRFSPSLPSWGNLYVARSAVRHVPVGTVYVSAARREDDPWSAYFDSSAAFTDTPSENDALQPRPPACADSPAGADSPVRAAPPVDRDEDGDLFAGLADEVRGQAGSTVLIHVPAPRYEDGTPFSPHVTGLLRDHDAVLARAGEPVHVRLLVIRRPHLFGDGPIVSAHVTADRVVVVIDQPADLAAAERCLGPDVVLAPTGPQMRALVCRLVPGALVAPEGWRVGASGVRKQRFSETSERDVPAGRRFLLVGLGLAGGRGAGQVTRLMAIGRRLPDGVRAVIVTQADGVALAHREGFLADHLPSAADLGTTGEHWNRVLRDRLAHLIAVHNPELVAVDGLPHEGLAAAVRDNPKIIWVWVRRQLWKRDTPDAWIAAGSVFDAVLEPGDLASAADAGPTAVDRARTHEVAPITLLDDHQLIPAAAAKAALHLTPDRPAALLRPHPSLPATRLSRLLIARGYQVVLARPPLTPYPAPVLRPIEGSAGVRAVLPALLRSRLTPVPGSYVLLPQTHGPLDTSLVVSTAEGLLGVAGDAGPVVLPVEGQPGVTTVREYPVSRYLKAFDLVVSASGYNACHEAIAARVPAVLIPDRSAPIDDQLGRARFAASTGVALLADDPDLAQVLDAVTRPEVRAALRGRCAELTFSNGAAEAAAWLCATVARRGHIGG